MSAFFVTAKTTANAVECMKQAGIVRDGLARELMWMNVAALVARYDDREDAYTADVAAYAAPHPSNDPYQVLKSADCLLYQCSEGDVDENPLFKELEAAIEALAVTLGGAGRNGNQSQRYDAAKWDIA